MKSRPTLCFKTNYCCFLSFFLFFLFFQGDLELFACLLNGAYRRLPCVKRYANDKLNRIYYSKMSYIENKLNTIILIAHPKLRQQIFSCIVLK